MHHRKKLPNAARFRLPTVPQRHVGADGHGRRVRPATALDNTTRELRIAQLGNRRSDPYFDLGVKQMLWWAGSMMEIGGGGAPLLEAQRRTHPRATRNLKPLIAAGAMFLTNTPSTGPGSDLSEVPVVRRREMTRNISAT